MITKKRGFGSGGQISIFMILALLIVIAGGLFFYYQDQITKKTFEILHPDVAPVKLYIDSCISSVIRDGLNRIGLSGGYIKIPEYIGNDPRTYLSTLPFSGFKMPYWWYDGISAIPSEEYIKEELKDYIKSEINSCTSEFGILNEKFEVRNLDEALIEIEFNDGSTAVGIDYPIDIMQKDEGTTTRIEKFSYDIPIRFKKAYELAKLVMERENADSFIERRTIDLYSMNRDIPTTDVDASCDTKTWRLKDIKDDLKNILRVNLPYIRIEGSDYNENLYVPNPNGKSAYKDTYFGHHFVWRIDKDPGNKYKNMKTVFSYENWTFDIYARPSGNGILKSNTQKGSDALSFMCLQIWHFTYDIEYPVMATVIDKKSKGIDEYRFSFAFKASIDHNQPMRIETGSRSFEIVPSLSPDEFCNDVQNEITFYTVDNATGDDLTGVNLTFICGSYYCDIGETISLSYGAASGLTKRLPYCVNALMKARKDGYKDSKTFLQTDLDGKTYVLFMNPEKEISNYKVVKHPLSSPQSFSELEPGEIATILIKGRDSGFEASAVYPSEAPRPIILPIGRDMAFDVTIYVADENDIVAAYSGEWKASKDQLAGSAQLIFHVVEHESINEEEMGLFISDINSHSKKVPGPELK